MLTIDEIKNISFRKATLSGGYRAEDVDAFIDEVIATLEQQKKEKNNLVNKLDRLAARLEEYKENEETVRNALITSQRLSDSCMKEANEKAAKILAEAETKASATLKDAEVRSSAMLRDAELKSSAMLTEAEQKTAKEKETYLLLHSDAVDLRNELIELYSQHIQNIDDFPTASDVEKSREMLEAKYPSAIPAPEVSIEPKEAAPAPAPAPEPAPAPAPEPEPAPAPEPEPAPAPEPEPAPAPEAPAEPAEEPAPVTRVVLKRPKKFKHLKFGDNYDVSDD